MKFEPIAYASHYGGRCRGCADENGVCPTSGLPCDPDERLKAAAHCLKAWQYGIEHGHMDNPFAPPPAPILRGPDVTMLLQSKAETIRTEYWLAYGKPCDCSTPDGALHYGRAQGLEMAADIIAPASEGQPDV